MFNRVMNSIELNSVGENVQALAEAIELMQDQVNQLDIDGKNLLIPLGASRTGKGTLLAALLGYKLKMFSKRKLKDN